MFSLSPAFTAVEDCLEWKHACDSAFRFFAHVTFGTFAPTMGVKLTLSLLVVVRGIIHKPYEHFLMLNFTQEGFIGVHCFDMTRLMAYFRQPQRLEPHQCLPSYDEKGQSEVDNSLKSGDCIEESKHTEPASGTVQRNRIIVEKHSPQHSLSCFFQSISF